MEILTGSKPKTSKQCKRQFEKEYLSKKDKLNHKSYEKIFKKDGLEKKRFHIPLLDKIIKIFEEEE